ncbi:helix-turn-helix domain-containing protein [Aurantiacibacter marinus]|uniref:helix-turn-helix domain-containing protein n=1 Tax=Aurantiacibacter marinus TaxID=874156 RepID=UPI00069BDCA8|nr:helix-turn-helix domain-containing protein [Aurantiacibacter marinus]
MSNRLKSAPAVSRTQILAEFVRDYLPGARADVAAGELGHIALPMRVAGGRTITTDRTSNAFVYLASGATKLIAKASNGREQIVAFHFAGELVSVPGKSCHSYNLAALVDCDALTMPADELLAIARGDPDFLETLLQNTIGALHRCRDKAVGLGRKNAQERLADFLVGMAMRIGQDQEGACLINLPMSRRDVGDSLGLTIETISRQFGELRELGLVKTAGRSQVFLPDIAGLRNLAGYI